nr:uncharacterized protein LOC128698890 [Cherax quadricarinatus]
MLMHFSGFDALEYEEETDYEIIQSTNVDFHEAVVRVNIFREYRQTIQVVNPLNSDGVAEEEVTMVELNSFKPSVLEEQVDKKFYLALNFNLVDNLLFFNPDLYSVNEVSDIWQAPTPQINNITFRFPLSPPLSQPSDPQPTVCFYDKVSASLTPSALVVTCSVSGHPTFEA